MRTLVALMLLIGAPPGAAVQESTPVEAICVSCRFEAKAVLKGYSTPQWKELYQGEVLTRDERKGTQGFALASGVIEQPTDRVWAVLTDFESWPGFMPHIKRTSVDRIDGQRRWVTQDFRVLLKRLRHTTIYNFEAAEGRLGWQLDLKSPHDIAASQGAWQLIRVDHGLSTLVRYQSRMDAGQSVPDFVEDLLLRRSLRQMLTSLRDEVMSRYRNSPIVAPPIVDVATPPE